MIWTANRNSAFRSTNSPATCSSSVRSPRPQWTGLRSATVSTPAAMLTREKYAKNRGTAGAFSGCRRSRRRWRGGLGVRLVLVEIVLRRRLGRLHHRLREEISVLAAVLIIFLLAVRVQIFFRVLEMPLADIIETRLVEQQCPLVVRRVL